MLSALKKARLPYAVAGGCAVALHGAVRGTVDLDLVVSLNKKNLILLEASLRGLGLVPRLPISAEEIFRFRAEYIKNRNLIAWSFVDPNNPIRLVDVLITEDISNHKVIKLKAQGFEIAILDISSLIKMKRAAGRPQDLEDIKALERLL